MQRSSSFRTPVASALAFILVGLTPGSARQSASLLAAASSSDAPHRITTRDTSLPTPAVAAMGQVPLHFAEAGDAAQFTARGRGYDVTVHGGGAIVSLHDATDAASVRLTPIGSGRPRELAGLDRLPGVVNRYVGGASSWQTGLATFSKVRATAVAPGIDVVYYGNQQQLEYDFVIAPGADPAAAGMRIDGADGLALADNGDLVVHVGDRELRQQRPVSWQVIDGRRVPVESRFVLDASTETVTFALGAYDPAPELVFDPGLVPVAPRPYRPFQGWRYLTARDAPADLGAEASGDLAEMPEALRRELVGLGLL